MRRNALRGMLGLGLGAPGGAGAQAEARRLWPEDFFPTLAADVEAAWSGSARARAGWDGLDLAEARRAELRAARWPTAGGMVQFNEQNERRLDGSGRTTKTYYSASVTMPLFHWGAIQSQVRQGELTLAMGRRDFADVKRLLGLEVRGQFLRLIVIGAGVRRAELALTRAEADLALVRDRIARGVDAPGADFGARLGTEDARLALERGRFEFEQAAAAFARLTSGPALGLAEVPRAIPELGSTVPEVQSMLEPFLAAERPPTSAVGQAELQVEMERESVRIARSRLRPLLNLVAGVTQDEASYFTDVSRRTQLSTEFVGVAVNWQIFDRRSRAQVQQAVIRRRAAENRLAALAEDVRVQARALGRQLEFNARALRIAEERFAAARGGLEFQRGEAKRGLIPPADIARAEVNFANDEANIYQARANFLMSYAEFLSLLGLDPLLQPAADRASSDE